MVTQLIFLGVRLCVVGKWLQGAGKGEVHTVLEELVCHPSPLDSERNLVPPTVPGLSPLLNLLINSASTYLGELRREVLMEAAMFSPPVAFPLRAGICK